MKNDSHKNFLLIGDFVSLISFNYPKLAETDKCISKFWHARKLSWQSRYLMVDNHQCNFFGFFSKC